MMITNGLFRIKSTSGFAIIHSAISLFSYNVLRKWNVLFQLEKKEEGNRMPVNAWLCLEKMSLCNALKN